MGEELQSLETPNAPALSSGSRDSPYHRIANYAVWAVPVSLLVIPVLPIRGISGLTLFSAIPAGVIALVGIRKHGRRALLWKGLFGIFAPIVYIGFLLSTILGVFADGESGYQQRDGRWVFVTSGFDEGHRELPVSGADPNSFRILSDPEFAADDHAVYWRNFPIRGADPETFRELEDGYWRDRSKVFMGHLEVKGADADTFRPLSISPWAVDKNDAYRGDDPVHAVDPSTFEPINFHYARDSKAYYAWTTAPEHGMSVPCDYASFRVLGESYAKDKDHAYWIGTPIIGSDPATFEVISVNRARDRNHEYFMDSQR